MASLEACYLPVDRLHSLAAGVTLPVTAAGSALFADISGFTPVTERLRTTLGARRGAEELAAHLNRVYDALIEQVSHYGGSVIGFAGDAITCWFGGEASAVRAAACGLALLEAMRDVARIMLPDGGALLLGLKVAITSGTTKRFIVGDGAIQLIDALAGATVARLAAGEALAARDELLADQPTVEQLGALAATREWRGGENERFAVLERVDVPRELTWTASDSSMLLPDEQVFPWLLPALARHIQAGLGEFQIELRPVTALFLRFSGIDYDEDAEAGNKLNQLVRLVQAVVNGYEGNVLQLTIGDKGSYLYAAFGAPFAHEDDTARALNAAVDLRDAITRLGTLDAPQIGISRGVMRTGAYGSSTRRTYGVLGDEVNLAARLMNLAEPGAILLSESILGARLDRFVLESLPPVQVKGKEAPIRLFRLVGTQERAFEARFYTTPLVGRDDELNSLREAVQPIFGGRHAGVIFVNGEPGMGKSRLAFEVQKRIELEPAGVTWLTGQADGLNRAPLSAFAYFLRRYFGQQRDRDRAANLNAFETVFDGLLARADEAGRQELTLYRSYLAGVVGLVISGSAYETADEKLRIDNGIAAIKALARAETRRQPLVLHLEDAHWLDPSSISTVQQLTYNMEAVPLALLLTSRYNDDGTPFTIPNIYSVPIQAFDLNRLSDEGVGAVAAAVLDGHTGDRLARFVRERAEGNPFFTEQLTLDLKERGALVETNGAWDIRPDAAAEVPSGVNAVLIARLDRLAGQVKGVVQTAAVLGREFDVMVLSRMLRDENLPAIREAEREAIWSALDELRYLFRHALLRDAAYAMQARERLKALHRLAAETIESLYPDDETQVDALLEHWDEAGNAAKALHYTVPVCERLVGIAADYGRAERLLEKALPHGETPQRATLLRLLGDVAQLRGEYAAAVAQYEACLTWAGAAVSQRILALDGLGRVHTQQGDYPTAIAFAEQALSLAREHQDRAGTARARVTLGDAAFQQGDYPTAQEQFSESLRLFRELDARSGIVGALNRLGKIATLKGDKTAARAYLEESLTLCQEMGDRQQLGGILNNLGNHALDQGDSQTTKAYYESSLRHRREIGDRSGVGASLGNLSILMLRQGNIAEGLTYAEASLSERRAIGDRKGVANALSLLASVAYDQNDLPAAQRYLEEALEITRAINDRWGVGTNLTNLGEIARMQGDYTTAQAYVSEGLALYRQLEQPKDIADALTTQAWLAQVQEDFVTARERYEEGLRIRREINDRRGIARSLLDMSSLDGVIGSYADAERRLTEALDIMQAIGDKNLSPSIAALAVIKRRLGQPSEAVRSLMREALTQVQAKAPKAKLATVIEAAQLLFENGQYDVSGEIVGLILSQSTSADVRHTVGRLLNRLGEALDAPALDAALERGRSLDLDAVIARLLADLA